MSTRSLVAIATVVWSVALFVGVFLGLPMLLTVEGVDVDAGLIVNALAAIGAFSAAAAAVWVATTDRRVQMQEREARRSAQATLVLVEVNVPAYLDYEIVVGNYGSRPVLNVTFESATFALRLDAQPDLLPDVDARISILKSNETHTFPVKVTDTQGHSVFEITKDEHGNEHYEENRDSADLAASVRFLDADGIWWRRLTSGEVIRLT